MPEIVIIGGGEDKAAIAAALAKEGHENIIVMTPDEAKKYKATPIGIQREIVEHALAPRFANEEKPFICKGKHRYIETAGQWVCQCGRNMND